ncbi:ABC transporter permease [Bacteroidota bacterium]
MIKNYFKIAIKNLLRNKALSIINISGLSIAMACSIVIYLWVKDETGYDSFYENSKELCITALGIEKPNGEIRYTTTTPGPLGPMVKDVFPEVVNSSRYGGQQFTFGTEDKRFTEVVALVDTTFFKMFTPDFIYGNPDLPFINITDIVLTRSMAEKFFGDENPLGKTLRADNSLNLTITGVIEDLPDNTHFSYNCLLPFDFYSIFWRRNLNDWDAANYRTYVQLKKSASFKVLEEKITEYTIKNFSDDIMQIKLQPVGRLHLYDFEGGGLITYIYVFSAMALFILLTACINYMNLSTARSAKRAREVGIRKVVGAKKKQLIGQFMGESLILTIIAANFAFIIAQRLIPLFNQISGKDLSFGFTLENILSVLILIFITGILAGSYPAFALSTANTTEVMKSNPLIASYRKGSAKGNSFRKILVVFQFSLSIFLIICSISIFKQLNYLKNTNLGFKKDNIIWLPMTRELSEKYTTFQNLLYENQDIYSVTRANSLPAYHESGASGKDLFWEGKNTDSNFSGIKVMGVDPEYLRTFDMEMAKGRFFSKEINSDITGGFILNETAVKAMNLEDPIGKRISLWNMNGTIVGIIKDFHFNSLHDKIDPMVIICNWGLDNIFVRINNNNAKTIDYIETTLKNILPGYNMNYEYVDDQINNSYKSEENTETIILYCTILAIFISCLGLFGLSSYIADQRTKEIGIRKILGSDSRQIVFLLSKEFLFLVIIANIIAWPVAWFVLRNWFQNFAYSTKLNLLIFICAGLAAIIIALLTISYKSIKVANNNPAEALRYE